MVEQHVIRLISSVLKLPDAPHASLNRAEIPAWDSLKHISIVFAIEDEFDVSFSEAEVSALQSSADITRLLREKGV